MQRNFIFLISNIITYFITAFLAGYALDGYVFTIKVPVGTVVLLFFALLGSLYTCYKYTATSKVLKERKSKSH